MIDVEDDGALRIITLDRPDKANALTREMLAALADTVERAAADPNVKVLVQCGSALHRTTMQEKSPSSSRLLLWFGISVGPSP